MGHLEVFTARSVQRILTAGVVLVLIGCTPLAGSKAAGSNPPSTGTSAASTAASPAHSGATATPGTPNYQPVTDIPIPPGTKINTERSVILGGPDRWFGRMVLILDRSTTLAYAYYLEQMPAFGWELITAVQGRSSMLTYVRGDRSAAVDIGSSGLRAAEVTITVSPRHVAPTQQPPAPSKK